MTLPQIRRTLATILGAIVALAAVTANRSADRALVRAAEAPALRPLDSPAPDGSAQPQVFASADGRIILSWLEPAASGVTRFRMAVHDGTRWSDPRTIVEGPDFFVNWADVPSVTRLTSGRLAGHWLQKSGPGTYAYDVKLRVSDDEGRTWSETLTPHKDGTATEHGFVSMYETPSGDLGLVWLDGRNMKSGGHDAHGGDMGAMTIRSTTLGADRRFGREDVVDDRVCECCPTSAVRTARGLIAAYRDRSETEVRDIFVSRFEQGRWTKGVAAHADKWLMPACPVNGPSLAARGDRVSLTWFTAEANDPRVVIAFSKDGGTTWGPPHRVDGGTSLGRVDSEMLDDGSVMVSWIEFAESRSDVRIRRMRENGDSDPPVVVTRVSSDRASGYPRIARSGSRLYLAWTETAPTKRIRMSTLDLEPAGIPSAGGRRP